MRWIPKGCYWNAEYNKEELEKESGRKLKIVYGSLGLNGFFEFGGRDWDVKDFYPNPFDSHAWLEDSDGNVYDYIFDLYGRWIASRKIKVSFPTSCLIRGASKKQLKEQFNIEYIPAPLIAQIDIVKQVNLKRKQLLNANPNYFKKFYKR
jgi:hypothetical protein